MDRDLLVAEYTELSLKWVSFAGPDPVDEKEQMRVACRIDEIRSLLEMEPIYLADELLASRTERRIMDEKKKLYEALRTVKDFCTAQGNTCKACPLNTDPACGCTVFDEQPEEWDLKFLKGGEES